jgi:hypothetical protein
MLPCNDHQIHPAIDRSNNRIADIHIATTVEQTIPLFLISCSVQSRHSDRHSDLLSQQFRTAYHAAQYPNREQHRKPPSGMASSVSSRSDTKLRECVGTRVTAYRCQFADGEWEDCDVVSTIELLFERALMWLRQYASDTITSRERGTGRKCSCACREHRYVTLFRSLTVYVC